MTELAIPKSKLAGIGPTMVTLLIVGYLGVDRIFHDPPGKALQAYQDKVTKELQLFPRCVGTWIGQDVPIEQSALTMLHLTQDQYISRQYSNGYGDEFTLLFVEVADSRNALGHYPPVCYPNQGWTSANLQGESIDWLDHTVRGREYAFDRTKVGSNSQIIVDDTLVLANAKFCRDMNELESSANDRLLWSYGVGQVQFVFGAESTPDSRRAIVETFLGKMSPIFDAMKVTQ